MVVPAKAAVGPVERRTSRQRPSATGTPSAVAIRRSRDRRTAGCAAPVAGDNKAPRSSAVPEGDGSGVLSPDMATDGHEGLIQPRKVPNPMRESRTHREMHRELLFSHSRGLLPRHRAELPQVLESRRLRQLREELQGPPSDLEQQLRKRHQRLEEIWGVAEGGHTMGTVGRGHTMGTGGRGQGPGAVG
ncbi:uncharacterized protein LOC128903623 isoform X2 [Rissa tridactyla]|uniref:uncharacterized protein LOC128903623 isoform X2 n=1 Tax=Rissa tridactyla TaxID=75485 RepID=UPI0023BA3FD0|nr:uncharacterized protein LOC128903623 isoform X2 [Rissa tridactyla]